MPLVTCWGPKASASVVGRMPALAPWHRWRKWSWPRTWTQRSLRLVILQNRNWNWNVKLYKPLPNKTLSPSPLSLKVMEWTEGKKKNIRALICSLHAIIWDGCKWNECGMHQLVQPNDVKKMYRKACLAVHPDKVNICRELFGNILYLCISSSFTPYSFIVLPFQSQNISQTSTYISYITILIVTFFCSVLEQNTNLLPN